MEKKIPVGVLGATGMVGQRFIQLLENHPWFEVAWIAASERSADKLYGDAAKWRMKTPLPKRVANMKLSPAVAQNMPKVIFRRAGCGYRARHGAAVRRGWMRGHYQFECVSDACQCAARDSGGECRSPQADRYADMAQELRWLYCHELELLCDGIGAGISASAQEPRDRKDVRGDDAGREWSGISGCRIAGYSWKCHPVHWKRRRKDGGRDKEDARRAERARGEGRAICNERAVQPRRR